MKDVTEANRWLEQRISRRKAIDLIGLSTLWFGIPFSCTNQKQQLPSDDVRSLPYKTLEEVAELIRTKKISSEALTKLMLERIATLDKRLHSYITVMGEDALKDAKALDNELAQNKDRGPLHGVPIGVKDLLYTTNAPTTGGHAFKANFVPSYNATVVDRLRNAGAVILGKQNLTEGATGGYNSTIPIPKNPWGEDLWTGLSSSGSGVATAAGLCFGSIGTDTGGSIRFPSFANGVVGLKPTYGLVSRYGVLTFADSLDHVGPICRSVKDAALMLEAIAGFDPNDPTSLPGSAPKLLADIEKGMKGLKLGVDHEYISKGVSPALANSIEAAVRKMEELGATIVSFKSPGNELENSDMWFKIATREAYEAHKATYPSKQAEYGKYLAEFLEIGIHVTDEQYNEARRFQKDFTGKFRTSLSGVDAFVSPTCGMVKGVTEQLWRANMSEGLIAHFGEQLNFRFCSAADLAGIPSLALPCGKAENDMPPPGLQLMGSPLTEAVLCRIGYAYEQATGWSKQHPSI